jgi:hypothetical protein
MKRATFWVRAAGYGMIAAALGVFGATALLRRYYPEPKLRRMIVDAARRQLGRDVRLEKIGVGLRGLTLRGLSVSESPDFAAGTFLSADVLRVRPSWRALLRRRLVVDSVAAEGLSVRLVKRADGTFNFSNLASTSSAGAAPSAPAANAPDAAFDVRRILATGSSLEYEDAAAGTSWKISALALDVGGLGPTAPFDAAASARVQGRADGADVDARVVVDARVDLARGSRELFSAEAKRLLIEQNGLKLEGRARVSSLDVPRVDYDLALSADGRRLLRASGTAKCGAAVEADVKFESDPLDAALVARLFPSAGLPGVNLPAATLDAAGTWTGATAALRSSELKWADGRVVLSGAARGLGGGHPAYDGTLTFAADVPKIERGRYPFLKLPPKLSLPALHAEGEVSLADGDVFVKSLTLRSALGTLAASGALRRALTAKPVPELTLKPQLSFAAFKAADLPFDNSLPPDLSVPPLKLDGAILLRGDDMRFEKVGFAAPAGKIVLDGTLVGALSGAWNPNLDAALELSLPALVDADLPFPGVPAGLKLPPSRWNGGISYTNSALRLRGLRARIGRNDVEADGAVSDLGTRAAFDALFKCRSFDLRELTGLTPATRDLQLAGTGYFALSVTGTKENPIFAGKVKFAGIGAIAAGLPLTDFGGTLSVDPTRFDAPNLVGKIDGGTLNMDLTVKNYSRAPEIQLEARLDRFDLGRYLDAKNRMLAAHPQAPAGASSKASAPSNPASSWSARGRFVVGKLIHPNATVERVHADWNVTGLHGDLADFKDLDGSARIEVGAGKLQDLGAMATQSKVLKIVLLPFVVIQKTFGVIGKVTGVQLLLRAVGVSVLPDFNNIDLRSMVGDYSFRRGVMTLNKSEMDTSAADVKATGTVDIPSEKLNLVVAANVHGPQIGGRYVPIPLSFDVGGTFDRPTKNLRLGGY